MPGSIGKAAKILDMGAGWLMRPRPPVQEGDCWRIRLAACESTPKPKRLPSYLAYPGFRGGRWGVVSAACYARAYGRVMISMLWPFGSSK
jgi:hypothetical protein